MVGKLGNLREEPRAEVGPTLPGTAGWAIARYK